MYKIKTGFRDLQKSNDDCLSQLAVNVISAVLDRNSTAVLTVRHYGDRFAAVAAQRKQKCVQILVICFDSLYNIFFSFNCVSQIHIFHPNHDLS